MRLRLYQIPFSHNCVKVRCALERKGIDYEPIDVDPMRRGPVVAATGQPRVPALVDGERAVADSTAILLHLEDRWPEPALLPRDRRARAECLVLEDWADRAFMALSRRLAYWQVLQAPGALERMFLPDERGLRRKLLARAARRAVARRFRLSAERNARDEAAAREAAGLAELRRGGREFLVGDHLSIADVALAAMSAPLHAASKPVREDTHVRSLLAWGEGVLGPEIVSIYRS